MKYIFISLIVITSSAIISCKKNDVSKPKTAAEKIQAKWQVVNVIYNDHNNGADHKITYTGTPSDYFDFRGDGKAYSNADGTMDTSTYTVLNNTRMIFNDDTAIIQNLSDNVFSMYQKVMTSSTDYNEGTINLKK